MATWNWRPISAASSTRERPTGTGGSPRFSSASGEPTGWRVYRLMKKHGLLLARHTGRRRPREHGGQVATLRSNTRWCSDGLEFTCWNGEIVRVAFALDCHDREVIGWVATTAGISGEMIRDMMVRCVEQRFGAIQAPHPVQWLSDNGSIFAAHKTIEIAVALNLVPCFTPPESPESNGMAEAFVKTFKRDCVRVSPVPNAAAALSLIDTWMEDYNIAHPHSRLGYRSPRSTSCPNPSRVRFNGVNSRFSVC
jgi:putative transposase